MNSKTINDFPEVASGQATTMKLLVNPIRATARDMVGNLRMLAYVLIALLVFSGLSSTVYLFAEKQADPAARVAGKQAAPMTRDESYPADFFDAIYFTITNVTTVGFGDIHPHSIGGKAISMLNSLVGVLLVGAFVAVFTAALQPTGFSGTGETREHLENGPPQQVSKESVGAEGERNQFRQEHDATNDLLAAISKLIVDEASGVERQVFIASGGKPRVLLNVSTEASRVSLHMRIYVETQIDAK